MTPAPPCCTHCRKPRKRRADNRGWTGYRKLCSACAERSRVAGHPADGPPVASNGTERAQRISAGLVRHHATHGQSQATLGALAAHRASAAQGKAGRLQDYAWLRSFGESRGEASRRAGVCEGWALREYDRLIAAMEASPAASAA